MAERPVMRAMLSPSAEQDIRELLQWTIEKFGAEAAVRYSALLQQALHDLEADPERIGVKKRPEVMNAAARTYHLSFSRSRVSGPALRNPRHFILYRIVPSILQIALILHDSRDLSRHLPVAFRKSDEN